MVKLVQLQQPDYNVSHFGNAIDSEINYHIDRSGCFTQRFTAKSTKNTSLFTYKICSKQLIGPNNKVIASIKHRSFFSDKYDIYDGNNIVCGTLTKQRGFIKPEFTLQMKGDQTLFLILKSRGSVYLHMGGLEGPLVTRYYKQHTGCKPNRNLQIAANMDVYFAALVCLTVESIVQTNRSIAFGLPYRLY